MQLDCHLSILSVCSEQDLLQEVIFCTGYNKGSQNKMKSLKGQVLF